MGTEIRMNLFTGSMIADRVRLALRHYQGQGPGFNEKDQARIQKGLSYIERIREAQRFAVGMGGRFTETGAEVRKLTYDLVRISTGTAKPNLRKYLDGIEETLQVVNERQITPDHARIEKAIEFFSQSRDRLRAKSARPMEVVKIMEEFKW